jgi:predicted ATPase
MAQLAQETERLEKDQARANQAATDLRQLRHAISRQASALRGLESKHKAVLEGAELKFADIVSVTVDYAPLDAVVHAHEARTAESERLLMSREEIDATGWDDSQRADAAAGSIRCQSDALEEERVVLVDRLDRPQREYQQYLKEVELWKQRQGELTGGERDPEGDTLRWLERELARCVTTYVDQLLAARAERLAKSTSIFQKKLDLTSFYNEVKQAIDRQVDECREELGEYNIAIGAGLRFKRTFADDFFGFVNQSAAGSFRGMEEGRERLRKLWDEVSDWQDAEEVFRALDSIVDALHMDQREDVAPLHAARNVFNQMKSQRSVQDLYDFLFSFDYLEPKYDLTVDQKDLSELSPGERGGLLLIFYLMLDRQDLPLVIDQPEDNLDNKSVYEILVTFIKEAKKRRQIILVTHNPNLAVVADAEQILHVSLDKKDGRNDFDFFSGAIEDPRVNRALVDILEGTLPAFDNRRLKYRKHHRSPDA